MTTKEDVIEMFNNNDFNQDERNLIATTAGVLCSDPDGTWSHLNDSGIEIDFEDVQLVCSFFDQRNNLNI
jgi:hypothetical protein